MSIVRPLCAAVLMVMLSFPSSVHASAPVPFPDMAGTWFRYRESVDYLKKRDAIKGYPDGTFKPLQFVSRVEFLKLVFVARGATVPAGIADCFSDIDPESWYAAYVCAAERRDIIDGYPDGTFKPEQTVTYAEALKILQRTYLKDIEQRSGDDWFEPYVAAFDRTGVLPRDAYIPWKELSRIRAADLIARLIRHEDERVIPNLSAGCGKVSVQPPTTLAINGAERSYLLTTPSNYQSHDPYPLLIAFHGRTNSNAQVRSYYGFDKAASDYFVVYPAALPATSSSFSWSTPNAKKGELGDIAFFDTLVETLGEHYCIDYDKLYVAGHSLGAWFANTVTCVRGDVVRASATVGGDSAILPCAGPSAAMIIHNPHDTLSPFSGSERVRDTMLKENFCEAGFADTEPSSFKCKRYAGCYGGNQLVFCPHEIDDFKGSFYPHQWPDGAGKTIVGFFEGLK
jgi:polyhydroxybutyrate depolymerase